MGEWADQWSAEGKTNIWGTVPIGGRDAERRRRRRRGARRAAGRRARHHLHRVAGPAADDPQHVQDRRRTDLHGLPRRRARRWPRRRSRSSAITATSWPSARPASACSSSNSVQEVMDIALIAQAATLEARIPFLHFFDGFRTSHEVAKIEQLTDDDLRAMIDDELVRGAPRPRALARIAPSSAARRRTRTSTSRPAKPSIRSTWPAPTIVQKAMDKFADGGRPPVPPLRLRRRAGCRARHRPDGLGRRSRRRRRSST